MLNRKPRVPDPVTHKRGRRAAAASPAPKRLGAAGKPARGPAPSGGKMGRSSRSRALEIKRRIQKGQYPVEEKLDQAIDRMLEKEDL